MTKPACLFIIFNLLFFCLRIIIIIIIIVLFFNLACENIYFSESLSVDNLCTNEIKEMAQFLSFESL